MNPSGDGRTNGLGTALAAEHAAIFAYGPIGVRLTGPQAADARAAEAAHRTRRDALVLLLTAGGGTAPPASASYELPFPVTDPAAALRLAVEIEERTGAVWRAALATTTGAERGRALDALTDCAVRATRWRRSAGVTPATVAFPGRPA
ncbi:ferritin-like domain-containing protein [Micromonospora sp. NBC_01699]|uniref:ferritin-like domain-containing protein n=1 Tax=Micromonospora sp. NBC_01699 TaxID=2975984 RepID=UPI002E3232DB|nr:ferritin-like domain-containing protein [Micromonospora sp. NBC_01699]